MKDTFHADWKAWTGPEIEGRLHGLPTLFIRDLSVFDNYDLDKIRESHVLIGPCWDKPGMRQSIIDLLLDAGKIVTLEVTPAQMKKLPDRWLGKINIIYDINVPEIVEGVKLLNPGDTIRLGRFDCLLFDVRLAQRPDSTDYNEDIEWVPED